MRICKLCGKSPSESPFYSGMTNRCKECHKAAVRKNREENVEYYRAYDAKRFKEDPKVLERHKRYFATTEGKEAQKRARTKFVEKSPEKRAAHVLLSNAVKSGRIKKPTECSQCGKHDVSRKIQAHHHDYAKPLEVIWLCSECHAKEHR